MKLRCCNQETIDRIDPLIVKAAVDDLREHMNPDTPIQAANLREAAKDCKHPLHTLVGWGWFQDKRMAEQARDDFARHLMRFHVVYSPPTRVPSRPVTMAQKPRQTPGRVPIALGHNGVGYVEASPSTFLERAVSGNPSCDTLLRVYKDWLPADAVKLLQQAKAAIQREAERLKTQAA